MAKKRAIYYYTSWSTYGRNYQIKDIPDEVTDICYAFYNVDSNGNVFSGDAWADTDKRFIGEQSVTPPDTWNESNPGAFYGNFGQIKKLQEKRKRENKADLNVQLSVGGWTWSKYFSDAVSTDSKRSVFVNNLIDIFKRYPIFNGVSIDWEYPSNDGVNYGNDGNVVRREDSANLILFLKQLRAAFLGNRMGHFKIAMCCTAAPQKAMFDVESTIPLIDEFHIMTYDMVV